MEEGGHGPPSTVSLSRSVGTDTPEVVQGPPVLEVTRPLRAPSTPPLLLPSGTSRPTGVPLPLPEGSDIRSLAHLPSPETGERGFQTD